MTEPQDPGKFILLLNDYHLRLHPRGAAEEQLVQHLVNLEWRLEHTLTIEAELYRHRMHEAAVAEPDAPVPSPCGPVALAFDADSQGPHTLTNLTRYETSLDRSIDRTRRLLRALQTERIALEAKKAAAEAALTRIETNYGAKPKSEGIAVPTNEVSGKVTTSPSPSPLPKPQLY